MDDAGQRDRGISLSDAIYEAYERRLLAEVKKGKVPTHVAVIMDGNRRFAHDLGVETGEGYMRGRERLEKLMEWCIEIGVRVITVYAFSTENMRRPREETERLMDLFAENFRKAGDDERVHKYRIRIRAIGQRSLLPEHVRQAIAYAEERTRDYDSYHYNVAVAYGGRQEIITAIREIAKDIRSGTLTPEDITEDLLSSKMYTKDLPDPDLIIRTSGEERISNFLLWQVAYSELYFCDVYWPGFRKIDLLRAIRSYQKRMRRMGR